MAHERLPSTLQALLSRRNVSDPPIDQITISGFGGWFIRFADGECEWEALPKPLEKVLIQMIRRGDPNLVISLAPIGINNLISKLEMVILISLVLVILLNGYMNRRILKQRWKRH